MTDGKLIKDLSEKELVDLIQQSIRGNHIEVSGVQVSSTTEPLREVEKTINRLIDKHKDFLLLRKELKLKTGFEG